MDPDEIEFLAEQEWVTVVPKFSDPRVVHLICGEVGPFRAGLPLSVPIWVALDLRRRHKCKVIPPDWMDVEILEGLLEAEKNSTYFTKMPSEHYMGIVHLLLGVAAEDIKDANLIRTAVKDLWDLRVAKARTSADNFIRRGGRFAGVNHMTRLEIATLRPLLTDALDTIHFLGSVSAGTLSFLKFLFIKMDICLSVYL
ncbi:hypothetical protein AAG570_010046 [Ranatra chinensis]|uniref:DNA replication complex GINS protein PSF2 n=1 Tax=Ranatra chinensis TaxID=642074 RepID=A0ABD0Z3J4_9HEMI